jgi:ribosomal protein L16 Arg81 hydroxylase
MPTPENSPEKKEDALNELMKKLEKEGMHKVQNLHNTNTCNMDTLTQIMKEGEEEFKQKTGRNMTYSEMRRMYG